MECDTANVDFVIFGSRIAVIIYAVMEYLRAKSAKYNGIPCGHKHIGLTRFYFYVPNQYRGKTEN